MEKAEFVAVVEKAASERGVTVADIDFNDDDNVFVVTIDKKGEYVALEDCEYVHRAVLDTFDRNIEDYSMTVTSSGIPAAEADGVLQSEDE